MDFNDPNHRRNNSTPPIPLQDFSQPRPQYADSETDSDASSGGRPRALSHAVNRLSGGRLRGQGSYAPVSPREPQERWGAGLSDNGRQQQRPGLQIPQAAAGASDNATPITPVDVAAFQSAMSGAGIGFGLESSSSPFNAPTPSWSRDTRTPSLRSVDIGGDGDSVDERGDYFTSGGSSDRTPLTDPRHLAPIAGASAQSTPTGRDQRSRSRSVRFSNVSPSGMSRLGDDLAHVEEGRRSSEMRRSGSMRRSLSPNAAGSTLARAGTIVRNMSTRIVNLSNEQDVVDRTMHQKRKSSVTGRHSTSSSSMPEIIAPMDGPSDTFDGARLEKTPSTEESEIRFSPMNLRRKNSTREYNPLKGKSWGIFHANSPIRTKLCDILVHPFTEPFIFGLIVLQTVLLAIDASIDTRVGDGSRGGFGNSWIDYVMLVLFSIYTVEIVARSIVSGFIINPVEYSTINRQVGMRQAIADKVKVLFSTPQTRPKHIDTEQSTFQFAPQPGLVRAFTTNLHEDDSAKGGSKAQRRQRLAHRAFLRHSFNRVDFIAVVSFWVSFVLSVFSLEDSRHIFVFRMLAALRILRLLYLTSGTTVILRSLKKAAPLLVNVAFLIGFFWLLFAIIGLQSFKSSLRRNCVWIDTDDATNNWVNEFQFCGGWLAENGSAMPWLKANGVTNGTDDAKGYICPLQSVCLEGENPYNGSVSFDNIFQSLEMVFVVMSSNTWSDLMYYLTQSDYLAAAIFFAFGIVILYFWLVNLLIAVITSSFQVIREEGKASAFTGEESERASPDENDETEVKSKKSTLIRLFRKTKWIWVIIIAADLIMQSFRSATMSRSRENLINNTETVVTLILLIEIIIRLLIDRRDFFRKKSNIADLALAVITSVIQIPPIRNSGTPYAWLSFFQILRIYRVVIAVPITRDLIMVVLGNFSGLANLILFVFLLTFLAAILASQMFRGSIPQEDASGDTIEITFTSMWNSFLGMYQIFSSEGWTTIVYNVTNYDIAYNTAWMGAAFFILWFVLANFITLNMFIAVIQENFDISEDEKRLQQVKAFLQQKDMGNSTGNLSLSTIFKYGMVSGRRRDPMGFGNATTEMLLKDAVVKDFLDDDQPGTTPVTSPNAEEETPILRAAPTVVVGPGGVLGGWWSNIVAKFSNREPNPFYSRLEFSRAYEDLDPRQMAKEVVNARERRKRAQREYLRKHPKYNVALFIFGPNNPIRKLCQRIVGPGRGGERIEGVSPSVPVWYAFSAFIYCAIVAMVLLACIVTPLYQKEYFESRPFSVTNWFVWTDLGFAILFTVEAGIKVVADGFFFTPNAYFRGSWGIIDGIVLITLWINVGSSLFNEGDVSRAVGAFKALRALRLLNVSDSARNNFHAVIVQGGLKVLSAAFVSISLLLPFAIYGLNLFVGKLQTCNDDDIINLSDCVGETLISPANWDILAPRVASNPYYSFDNFGESLFILFQIVSQEGWNDVMWSAIAMTKVGQQPVPFTSYGNGVFFVVFNLLGAVFVLTLFVSVFMRNYTEQTGVAFLTAEQRSWLELRKLLRQISPSKRPLPNQKRETWKEWCYKRAVRKTGKWSRFVTGVLVLHLIFLCIEFYPDREWWDLTRNYLFLAFILLYISNIVIRIVGLTWPRYRRSSWDLYAMLSVSFAFVTMILAIARPNSWAIARLQRLALVSIALLLIPRNNQLDQLFKTAAASLPLIANLLATWFVLFLVFAIALTQTFSLTKFGEAEDVNVNFRNVPKALILLFRCSIGEGWNQLMEDFAVMRPPYCQRGLTFRDGDCGSEEWARFLFISWNILSMYLFVNLFVSLIYESFSYVYQRSNGLSVISREEIRRFKQAWAEFDPDGTGYITKEAFPRLLGVSNIDLVSGSVKLTSS